MKIRSGDVTIISARLDDLQELNELYSEACGYFKFDTPCALHSPEACLAGGDLPPGGVPENYELLVIRVGGTMIGYTSLYREFPSKATVHIPFFFIGAPARGCGFGMTAAQMLCRYFYETGYNSICTTVSLRNWGALRFCSRLGFDFIAELTAEGDIDDGGYGGMKLVKVLREPDATELL